MRKLRRLAVVAKRSLTRLYTRIRQIAEPVFAITGYTSALYYLLFSSSFRREQKAVLKGKIAYRRSLRHPQGTSYLLRRNVHRLEKGLIMEPRREVFARNYIAATVDAFAHACETETVDRNEREWACGVLAEYFNAVNGDSKINRAQARFESIVGDGCAGGPKPYAAESRRALDINAEQFAKLCDVRRSVRWYEQTPVPRDAIDRAIRAAGTTPSACNRQPFKYLIYDDPRFVQEISSIPGGTKGFSDNFPAVAVLVGDLGAYFDERDRHLIYIDGSLSAMAFMFALQTEGISSCSINWPDTANRERAMRQKISLEENKRIVMLISFGYARGGGYIPVSVKKSVDQLRSYNDHRG